MQTTASVHRNVLAHTKFAGGVTVPATASVNSIKAGAQVNSSQYDMKSVTDDIIKSLTKLTGGNSSNLLKNTIVSR